MPDRTEYAQGEFSWADLTTTDVEAAGTFYSTLFGWTPEPIAIPEAGGYTMLSLGGKLVGALSPAMPGDPSPPHWTVYVNVDDADKTTELVQAAGGTVLMGVMDVFTSGRMAIFADAQGAAFAVWQPQDHTGAQVTDENGALTWFELMTDDTTGAQAFYGSVFGWGSETSDGGGMPYTEFKLADRSIAGMMAKQPGMEMPSAWMPYFQVADPDKIAAEAKALGGAVYAGPADIPSGGRFAVLADPQGAAFGIYRPGN